MRTDDPTSPAPITVDGFRVGDRWVYKRDGVVCELVTVGWDVRLESYWFVLRRPDGRVRRLTPTTLVDQYASVS